jgi:hypothetical protein
MGSSLGLAPFFGAKPKLGPSFAELLLALGELFQKKNPNANFKSEFVFNCFFATKLF